MIRLTFSLLFLAIAATSLAQSSAASASNKQSAVYAYAKGDDSYLKFSADAYSPEKKYVVIKFWNAGSALPDDEKAEMEYLKKYVDKKNVDLVFFPWSSGQELQQTLSKYGFSAEVINEKRISIKGENVNLNTTAGKAVLVLENGKPLSLCSGKNCGEMLKSFFRLKSPA